MTNDIVPEFMKQSDPLNQTMALKIVLIYHKQIKTPKVFRENQDLRAMLQPGKLSDKEHNSSKQQICRKFIKFMNYE